MPILNRSASFNMPGVRKARGQGRPGVKAIVYDRFGPVDVLRQAEIDEPTPAPGQVLVSVRAAAVNVIDNRTRAGLMGPLVNKKFPKIPGSDLAGVVKAVGRDVAGFTPGMRVFGGTDPLKGGAFAQTVAAPAGQIAPIPDNLPFETAAALPIAGLAALYALRDLGDVQDGQAVLVHGASGALGLYAVQLAKIMGARVTAVCGSSGAETVKALGADSVIDYRRQEPRFDPGSFDVVINASGKFPYALARSCLTPAGRLIEPSPTIAVFIGSKLANLFRAKRHLVLATVPRRPDLDYLASLVAEGRLTVTIGQRYALPDAKQAFKAMEQGGALGKVVVSFPPDEPTHS